MQLHCARVQSCIAVKLLFCLVPGVNRTLMAPSDNLSHHADEPRTTSAHQISTHSRTHSDTNFCCGCVDLYLVKHMHAFRMQRESQTALLTMIHSTTHAYYIILFLHSLVQLILGLFWLRTRHLDKKILLY